LPVNFPAPPAGKTFTDQPARCATARRSSAAIAPAQWLFGGCSRERQHQVNDVDTAGETELVIFERAGDDAVIEAVSDATIFVMNGQPIDEPVVGHGPFVMNTQEQISQAFVDLHHGKFGNIPA
jgi:redox-sensitive bicupin YhaK (pirin superfamily)